MSLLADLLSKARNENDEKNTAVPPHLANIITRASDKKRRQTRFIIVGAVVVVLVIAGFAAVHFMQSYIGSDISKVPIRPQPTPPPAPRQAAMPAQEGPAKVEAAPESTAKVETPQKQAGPAVETIKTGPSPSTGKPATITEEGRTIAKKAEVPPKPDRARSEVREPAAAADPPAVEGTARNRVPERPVADAVGAAPPKKAAAAVQEKPTRMTAADRRKSDRDAALYTARNYEDSGNYSQAIAHYKKALQSDGRNFIVLTSLSGLLIKTGAYAESAQYSRYALNMNRNYVPAMVNLAIASIQSGNTKEGEENLLRARSLEPSNRSVLFNLALLYENQQRYKESGDVYERIAATGNGQGLIGMGRVLEKQGKREDAKKVYRDILSSRSTDASTKQYANERLVILGN